MDEQYLPDITPYFYADFNADFTLVWAQNCTQIVGQNESVAPVVPVSCMEAPTSMVTAFKADDNNDVQWIGSYQKMKTNGLTTSGERYLVEVCQG
jgi:hypothetical protein